MNCVSNEFFNKLIDLDQKINVASFTRLPINIQCVLFQNLEEEVFRSRQDVLEAQSRSTALSIQLSSVEREGADKEQQLCQIK